MEKLDKHLTKSSLSLFPTFSFSNVIKNLFSYNEPDFCQLPWAST